MLVSTRKLSSSSFLAPPEGRLGACLGSLGKRPYKPTQQLRDSSHDDFPQEKYRAYPPVNLPDRQWPNRTITKPPSGARWTCATATSR